MRYYWEALFSTEYFPYWEFTMVGIEFLTISIIIRLSGIKRQLKEIQQSLIDMDEIE